ncbi:MAG: DUF1018 domain-containing protein [Chromatiaceae bacterium]|nr:DUF1018 domain-containing protein [Chromatiaceae bacterium]MBP8282952.1 DUF1018 domain-containing protein [Chromatiaceae bacterium]
MSTAAIPSSTRSRHLAFVHAQAKLFDLDPKSEAYRTWLKRRTGTTSCRDLDDAALATLADSLKATGPQWHRCYQLARALGFSSLEDVGFLKFMTKITKETERWHLSRRQLSHLLIALQKWLDHRTRQADAGQAPAPVPPPLAPPDPAAGPEGPDGHEKALTRTNRQGLADPTPGSILEPSSVALETLPR